MALTNLLEQLDLTRRCRPPPTLATVLHPPTQATMIGTRNRRLDSLDYPIKEPPAT